MLHVLLVILKVVGIVILSILLVLLLLLMLVLFVPVRYQVYASKNTNMYAKAYASWLFHIIHFSFCYDSQGIHKSLRIFGISTDTWKKFSQKLKRIFQRLKCRGEKSKASKRKPNKSDVPKELEFKKNDDKKLEEKPMIEAKKHEKTKQVINSKNDSFTKDSTQNVEVKDRKRNKKKSFHIKAWYLKIVQLFKNIKQKVKNIFKKIIFICKNANAKISKLKVLIQDERNKKAFLLCKEQFIRVLLHVKPKKYRIHLKYGTGDPAVTGQILGILGMLMPIYKNNAHIVPDFENAVFEGDIYMKGRITLARILLIGWKLYRDKNIKRCYKLIMD
jgi:hypothetical protein